MFLSVCSLGCLAFVFFPLPERRGKKRKEKERKVEAIDRSGTIFIYKQWS